MSRSLTYLVGPEVVVLVAVLATQAVVARHGSGSGRDLRIVEQMVMALPPLVALAAFLTVLVPGARDWWWLGRAVVASFVGAGFIAARCISAFGAGAKGQDAAFIMAFVFTGAVVSVGVAVAGAMIKAATTPAFADWFRLRPVLGSFLTLLAAVPIGIGLLLVVGTTVGVVLGLWSAFTR